MRQPSIEQEEPISKLAYDPRDPAQDLNDPATWKETDNPALLTASKRIERGEDYWRGVAMLAEMWDEENRPGGLVPPLPI
ncbi:hypothetical protein [Mesorhizobium sp. M4A.F.Ca.ET.090.04.2.1]|uniref:hypothetical protein n=1 Tax=Mesorhizobium sp. M4A.F.Ca.ET.090.04.2.1 TaxID=2496663 RepID=UPI00167C321B|nr:hypothetical protein [Mesorhizobium sp. M4A.F.Ca.ET.090.04.2.1]